MTTAPLRQPSGSPAGGQFAGTSGAESGLQLSTDATTADVGSAHARVMTALHASTRQRAELARIHLAHQDVAGSQARAAAKHALRRAAQKAGWSDANLMYLRSDVHRVALAQWASGPDSDAVINAAIAAAGHELVGRHGYSKLHEDTLTASWRQVFDARTDA